MSLIHQHSIRKYLVASVITLSVLGLSACGDLTDKQTQAYNDAPVDKSKFHNGIADGPAFIVNNPDGFSNLAVKCINGTAIITAFHGNSAYASVTVAENSALCK